MTDRELWEYSKQADLEKPPTLNHTPNGYVRWQSTHKGRREVLYVHQLLAIAEGEDPHEVFSSDNDVHHGPVEIPWANWPGNVSVISRGEHITHHRYDPDAPYRDPERLERVYNRIGADGLSSLWDCSEDTIYRWLEEFGIPKTGARTARSDEKWLETLGWTEMVRNTDKPKSEIAKSVGVAPDTFRTRLRRSTEKHREERNRKFRVGGPA